jgi:6-pyruvoyltetrahydropterin/6-carboxytetrahydropterin synthase
MALNLDPSRSPGIGGNSYAGIPTLIPGGAYLEVRITLAGNLEPNSQYLVNIKTIDDAVRRIGLPILRQQLHSGTLGPQSPLALLSSLRTHFAPADLVEVEIAFSPFLIYTAQAREQHMVRLSCRFEFSAAHRLHNPALSDADNRSTFGKCNNPLGHGHNYQLQVTVRGSDPPQPTELENIVDEHVLRAFDHKHLNLEVAEFRNSIPSVENIAQAIYRRLRPVLPALAAVTVWETPKTWAEYSE